MCSYNNKWWMIHYDKKHLIKYDQTRCKKISCVLLQLQNERWYIYSCLCKFKCQQCIQSYSSLVIRLLRSGLQGHRNTSKGSEYCWSVKKGSIDLTVVTVVCVYLCILLLYSIVNNNHGQQAYRPLHSCSGSYSCWNWAFNAWNNNYY